MRVLISGAGIAGSTAAFFLAKAGARVTVLEKCEEISRNGQNIDMEGSAVQIVKNMGLLDEVKRYNTTEIGTQFVNSQGRPIAQFPLKGKGRSATPTSEFEILRADLATILYHATNAYSNVNYMFDTSIQEVLSQGTDDEPAKVKLSNGNIEEADVLIAADGQWSKLRQQCFDPESINVVDMGMYGVYWTIPRTASDNQWWNIYQALDSRMVNIRPDPHGTMRAMFTRVPLTADEKKEWSDASRADRQTKEDLLRKEFAGVGWQAQRLLDSLPQAPDFYFHPFRQIRMTKWSRARVVCLGDAAYCPTPLTGAGTSMAIIGAYLLAGELSELNNNAHPAKAFEAYENKFRPHVESTQHVPSIFPGIAHPKTAFGRFLFQSSIWTIAKILAIPWVSNRINPDEEQGEDFPLPQYTVLDQQEAKV